MRSCGWVIIQYEWCPNKRKCRHRHTQGKPCERTEKMATEKSKKEALEETNLFTLRLLASSTIRKLISVA